jgi:catechol 2,3-dioxygenase-like lactoylglutathione lyase family enzyme
MSNSFSQSASFPGNFVHSVYFWLNNPENEDDRSLFLKNLNVFLENSQYLTSYHVAPPAGTDREVVDNSYHFNLVVTFHTKEEQDKYQTEEAHLTFIESSKHLWNKVQIYDSYREPETQAVYSRGDIQIGVVVSDLERSVSFYTEVLGMTKTGGFDVPKDVAIKTGLTSGSPLKVTVLKLQDNPQSPEWKLMSFGDSPKSKPTKYINEGSGMRYITLFINDPVAMVERLKKHSVKLLGETPVSLGDGRQFILIQDPDGNFIELIGPKP